MSRLLDLQNYTSFKSLKFGKDKIGGGDSGQPFIQSPIPNIIAPTTPDFLLRGGALKRTTDDITRISKFFFDKPVRGLLFTIKQNVLSQLSVKTQASRKIGVNGFVYLPTNTLAQVASTAFGGHLNKQGIVPIDGIPLLSQRRYMDVITEVIGDEIDDSIKIEGIEVLKDTNRLTTLLRKNISVSNDKTYLQKYFGGPGSIGGIGFTYINFATDNYGNPDGVKTGINNWHLKNKKALYSTIKNGVTYNTFDISNRGINILLPNIDNKTNKDNQNFKYYGVSNIANAVYNSNIELSKVTLAFSNPFYNGGTYCFSNTFNLVSQIVNFISATASEDEKAGYKIETIRNTTDGSIGGAFVYPQEWFSEEDKKDTVLQYQTAKFTKLVDFRKHLRNAKYNLYSDKINNSIIPSNDDLYDYSTKNIEINFNLGDPGKAIGGELIDKVNHLPLYTSDTKGTTKYTDAKVSSKDIITFKIQAYNPNVPNYVNIHFRAYLNQISDQYGSEWEATKYIGRGENFYTYKGFDRKISLSWTVVAQSKQELLPMYEKLNYLASLCAPDYSKSGYMRGNILTLTVGNYIKEQRGILQGLTYEMNDENATWDIDKEVPHLIKVSGFSFIPLHDFAPRKQLLAFGNGGNSIPPGEPTTEPGTLQPENVVSKFPSQKYISTPLGEFIDEPWK